MKAKFRFSFFICVIIAICLFIFSLPLNAQISSSECSPKDFRSKLPPVREQDSIGWCYAFVAADLISFEIGESVSPIYLANISEKYRDTYRSKFIGLFEKRGS